MAEPDLRALIAVATGGDAYTLLAHGLDDEVLDCGVNGSTLRSLRAPIIADAPRLLPLLTSNDVKQRIAAAQLLAVLPEISSARPAIEAALVNERDELVRYNQLFALVRLGVHVDVPDPRGKDPVLAVTAGFVRAMRDRNPDPALVEAARAITKLTPLPGFPGGEWPLQAVTAGLVGIHYSRADAQGLASLVPEGGNGGNLLVDAFRALWPFAETPAEPVVTISPAARDWLRPLSEPMLRPFGGLPYVVFARYGLIPGPSPSHFGRVLGMSTGASDRLVGDVPAWLLARRIVDGRERSDGWLASMATKPPAEVLAIVHDLVEMCIPEPWPPPRLPYTSVPTIEANARYFALMRPTFALLPTPALESFLAEPTINGHHATAFATLIERGIELPSEYDARIAQALAYLDEYDVESLRIVVRSLSLERRATVLAQTQPQYISDSLHGRAKLSGLWRFVDLMPDVLIDKLVENFGWSVQDEALTKPKTSQQEAVGREARKEFEAAFRALGERAVPSLRAVKPKPSVRAMFELALIAAGAAPTSSPVRPNKGKPKSRR